MGCIDRINCGNGVGAVETVPCVLHLATYGRTQQVFRDESPQIAKQVSTDRKMLICGN
jgi:hypothetical protein